MRVDVIDTSVEAVLGAITRIEERVRWGVRCVAKALLLPALVMLVGCASSPSATPASPNAGRYQISQDRAPTRVLKASEVRDVVPTAINRTMAGNRSPYEVLGKRYRVMSSEEGYFERGVASWYGEKYQGIRPAPGYPACPDHSEKEKLFEMLKAKETIGVALTESYAMYPAASVSGYVFAQKDAQYFNVGKIQQDQVEEYAVRKGQTIDTIKKLLPMNT